MNLRVMEYNKVTDSDLAYFKSIVAPDRISTGESVLGLHSRDESYHNPSLPEVVIFPLNREEVSKILAYSNGRCIPVTAWGAGTSLEGNPIPVFGGVVLDFSRMDRILEIREQDFQADVEPGVIYQDLNEKLRHKGLFFPPDPGARATIGGMIANNASGTRTVRYGSTKDHILRLVVALASGEIIELGRRVAKSSSGYDLLHLFVGSEGTLGVVVEATVHLVGVAEETSAAVATFASVPHAAKAVSGIIRAGLNPAMLELIDPECIEVMNEEKGLGLKVSPTVVMEFHGPHRNYLKEVMSMAEEICIAEKCNEFRPGLDRAERDKLLEARHRLGEMITRRHTGRAHIVIDVAVPITAYPDIIAFAREEKEKAGVPGYIFSHAGDGNLHLVFMVDKNDKREWSAIEQVNQNVVSRALSLGGTATGEHGVGIGKSRFMEQEHGMSLEWMKRIKKLFDPNGILNPGKIFV